jgi:heme-degrading monooxygenase HmoA
VWLEIRKFAPSLPSDLANFRIATLARIDGFISVERFQSLADPAKLLSLSVFRDEDAVRAWRNLPGHRAAQARGRAAILDDYRLRVARVLRDYGKTARDEAPPDSHRAHARRLADPG